MFLQVIAGAKDASQFSEKGCERNSTTLLMFCLFAVHSLRMECNWIWSACYALGFTVPTCHNDGHPESYL